MRDEAAKTKEVKNKVMKNNQRIRKKEVMRNQKKNHLGMRKKKNPKMMKRMKRMIMMIGTLILLSPTCLKTDIA